MNKHTQSPWAIYGNMVKHSSPKVCKNVCGLLAKLGDDGGWVFTPEDKANAHLISAAPELLEVLEECLPYAVEEYEACLNLRDAEGDEAASKIKLLIDKANAAISKARGRK